MMLYVLLGLVAIAVRQAAGQCNSVAVQACFMALIEATTPEWPENSHWCMAVHQMLDCTSPYMKKCNAMYGPIFTWYVDTYNAAPYNCSLAFTEAGVCDHNFDLYFIVDTTMCGDWKRFIEMVSVRLNLHTERVGIITFNESPKHLLPIGAYKDMAELSVYIRELGCTTEYNSDVIKALKFFDSETEINLCPVMGFMLTYNTKGNLSDLTLAARAINEKHNKRIFSFFKLDSTEPKSRHDWAYLNEIATPGLTYVLFDDWLHTTPASHANDVVATLYTEAQRAKLPGMAIHFQYHAALANSNTDYKGKTTVCHVFKRSIAHSLMTSFVIVCGYNQINK